MAFLRVKPAIAGLVMADFDSSFRNAFFQGRLDANLSVEAVTSAAIVAARALHALAWDDAHGLPLLQARLLSSLPMTCHVLGRHVQGAAYCCRVHGRQMTCVNGMHAGGQDGGAADSGGAGGLPAARGAWLQLPAGAGAHAPQLPCRFPGTSCQDEQAHMSWTGLSLMQCTLPQLQRNSNAVQGLMNPVSSGEPAHYIGPLPALGQDGQDPSPFLKKDVERFLWNFLAACTALGTATTRGERLNAVR
jgi:hypothetical protein